MKLVNPERPNYSRYGKVCDLTFYHDSQPNDKQPPGYVTPPLQQHHLANSTYGFSSISREKRGNFRFSIRLPHGEFTHKPNHLYGRSTSPAWSFPKQEKYDHPQVVEYEICARNHILKQQPNLQMNASTTSITEHIKDKVKFGKSSSFLSTKEHSFSHTQRNYSIISPRDTSPVAFFQKTKIENPRYISSEDLKKVEQQLDEHQYQKRMKPCPRGYHDFQKKKARKANFNSKGFQTFLYSNKAEHQINNFSLTKYPTHPSQHIDFQLHLDRPSHFPEKLGPNTDKFSIDYTRVNKSKIDLSLGKFRNQIKTRYDRVEAEPNTRLDYDCKEQKLSGMVMMQKVIGRCEQLFPIVDPAIKKSGDNEMKENLRLECPCIDLNEAMRPKVVQNYRKMVSERPE